MSTNGDHNMLGFGILLWNGGKPEDGTLSGLYAALPTADARLKEILAHGGVAGIKWDDGMVVTVYSTQGSLQHV